MLLVARCTLHLLALASVNCSEYELSYMEGLFKPTASPYYNMWFLPNAGRHVPLEIIANHVDQM